MERTFSLEELPAIAGEMLQMLGAKKVVVFHGAMGAGKTTFITALCDTIGVEDVVGSPTFSLVNEYQSPAYGQIYHIDLYRLNDLEEAIHAGIEDCLYSGDLCLVEWPERAPALFPDETWHVYLEALGEHTRRIRF